RLARTAARKSCLGGLRVTVHWRGSSKDHMISTMTDHHPAPPRAVARSITAMRVALAAFFGAFALLWTPLAAAQDTATEYEYDYAADTSPEALEDFQTPLEPYGTWVDDPTYGTIWV